MFFGLLWRSETSECHIHTYKIFDKYILYNIISFFSMLLCECFSPFGVPKKQIKNFIVQI